MWYIIEEFKSSCFLLTDTLDIQNYCVLIIHLETYTHKKDWSLDSKLFATHLEFVFWLNHLFATKMPTVASTKYTNFKKKYKWEQQKLENSSSETSSDSVRVLLAIDKNQSLEFFKLPHLKHPRTLPARPLRQISERKEHSVNPFPKRGSGEWRVWQLSVSCSNPRHLSDLIQGTEVHKFMC